MVETFELRMDWTTGEHYLAPNWLDEDYYYQMLEEAEEDKKQPEVYRREECKEDFEYFEYNEGNSC